MYPSVKKAATVAAFFIICKLIAFQWKHGNTTVKFPKTIATIIFLSIPCDLN